MIKNDLEFNLENLRKTPYEIHSPKDTAYNCIAWILGDEESWWSPVQMEGYRWPKECPRNETIEAYVCVFKTKGYKTCKNSNFENGYDKIVIYAVGDRATHVSRLLADGRLKSKCGNWEDIVHTLEGLEGEQYGKPNIFMRKKL